MLRSMTPRLAQAARQQATARSGALALDAKRPAAKRTWGGQRS